MIKMIAACSKNGVIGLDGGIPFYYPADMKNFKALTLNSTVIMGRKTFESIGKPLPKRRNIVISKKAKGLGLLKDYGIETFSSLSDVIETTDCSGEIWLIGGASIYQEGMKYAEEIHLTITPDEVLDSNAIRFPWINPRMFSLYSVEQLVPGDDTLQYVIYRRK